VKIKGGDVLSQNGNGRGFFNPIKTFIRAFLKRWEKTDHVSGELYLVDSKTVEDDLEDVADEPSDQLEDDRN
jgi:hypothetical protein